jgi:DNA invertase Pin-like site-specific DNA recombinase
VGSALQAPSPDWIGSPAPHQGLLSIVQRLDKKGVALRILDFAGSAIDTTKAVDKLLITVFGAFAEFERNLMLERQREGIAKGRLLVSEH